VKLLKNNLKNFYIIALGFVLILLGGITDILSGWLFWYPLGLITIPFISAWISWAKLKMQPMEENKK
jgi:hypothetical protein